MCKRINGLFISLFFCLIFVPLSLYIIIKCILLLSLAGVREAVSGNFPIWRRKDAQV